MKKRRIYIAKKTQTKLKQCLLTNGELVRVNTIHKGVDLNRNKSGTSNNMERECEDRAKTVNGNLNWLRKVILRGMNMEWKKVRKSAHVHK